MSIGEKLRAARETKCLSIQELSESTHVDENIIRELENDDFHSISAAVYGQGFIRLCASRLGLDPVPLLEEFVRTYRPNMAKPAEGMVGNYRAQEALYRERAGDSHLFQPTVRPPVVDTNPRPLEEKPAVPIQVTVQVAEQPRPAPVHPVVTPTVQPPSPPPVPPATAAFDAPRERTIVLDGTSSAPASVDGMFDSLFQKKSGASTQMPISESVSPPSLEDDENSLFSQATRKPKPRPVDPEDGKPRPMTGIFVPPARRRAAEEAAAAAAAANVQTPIPAPAPAPAVAPPPKPVEAPMPQPSPAPAPKPAPMPQPSPAPAPRPAPAPTPKPAPAPKPAPPPKPVKPPRPPRVGPSPAQLVGKAIAKGLKAAASAIGRGLALLGRLVWKLLRLLGAGLRSFFIRLGRGVAHNIRSIALVGVGLVVLALGVWAVLGIQSALREARERKVPDPSIEQESQVVVEMALPPPSLYAE